MVPADAFAKADRVEARLALYHVCAEVRRDSVRLREESRTLRARLFQLKEENARLIHRS